jgi:hypothetical protein
MDFRFRGNDKNYIERVGRLQAADTARIPARLRTRLGEKGK